MTIIVGIVFKVLWIIRWAIVIEAILSFAPVQGVDKVRSILHIVTEPFLYPFRVLQEKIYPGFMMDFSPIGAIVLIGILMNMLTALMR